MEQLITMGVMLGFGAACWGFGYVVGHIKGSNEERVKARIRHIR